ncbi:PIG-L deacetylase family protein [Vibrio vulnificus]|uniref:PIG-L deacetylase family protein n=1 Tax=Vibrio vulnificus TaxID=672 RepID=UPI0005F24A4E|nr:PIG-L family deacetylase [Vibrio vulnificus]
MVRNKIKKAVYSINLSVLNLIGFTKKLKAQNVKNKIDVCGRDIVVISPHPDDETIGCSSVIHDSASNGNKVHVFLLTGNKVRVQETKKALHFLHENISLHCLCFPDGELSFNEGKITQQLVNDISNLKLSNIVLFLPYKNDFHADHIAAYFSGMNAYKSLKNVSECYSYRTNHVNLLSDFSHYNTISIAKKRKSYSCFISQDFLCFDNLSKVRHFYHFTKKDVESELFCLNKLENIDSDVDIRKFKKFEIYENKLSDIHPYKFAFNHKYAHREFLKHVEKKI